MLRVHDIPKMEELCLFHKTQRANIDLIYMMLPIQFIKNSNKHN